MRSRRSTSAAGTASGSPASARASPARLCSLALCWRRLPSCPAAAGAVRRRAERPNVLLVTIDTLRADRLGLLRLRERVTPDPRRPGRARACGSRPRWRTCRSPVRRTRRSSPADPARPRRSGTTAASRCPPSVRTAAEDFRAGRLPHGRVRLGVPARPALRLRPRVRHLRRPPAARQRPPPHAVRRALRRRDDRRRAALAAAARRARRRSPFFLWVHYYDPHAPYEPPADLAARFRDVALRRRDRVRGRAARAPAARARSERRARRARSCSSPPITARAWASTARARTASSSTTRRCGCRGSWPGRASRAAAWSTTVARRSTCCRRCSTTPACPPRAGMDGRSLRPAADGREMEDAPAYAESLYPQLRVRLGAAASRWRTARYKLIEAPRPELYDLAEDAGGDDESRGRRSACARTSCAASCRPRSSAPDAGAAAPVDAETARAAGARSGTSAAARAQRAAGATAAIPRTACASCRRLNRGMSVARTEPEIAIRELTAVLAEDPGPADGPPHARGRLRGGGTGTSARSPTCARSRRPGSSAPRTASCWATTCGSPDDLTEAAAVLEAAARDNPKFAQPWLSLAEVHIAARPVSPRPRPRVERALELVPDHLEALRRLGDLALRRGDLEAPRARATPASSRSIRTDAAAMSKLGVVRVRSGRADEGIALFRQAVERDPANGEALLYLAGALASSGRPARGAAVLRAGARRRSRARRWR